MNSLRFCLRRSEGEAVRRQSGWTAALNEIGTMLQQARLMGMLEAGDGGTAWRLVMVDVRGRAIERRKRKGAEPNGVLEFLVAGLVQFEDDARLVDVAAHELKQRREDLWVGACRGDLHVEKSLRTLLERFDAVGRSDVPVSIMFVSADGQLRIIR